MSLGYLLASLPMLLVDRPTTLQVGGFLSACESALSGADYAVVAFLVGGKMEAAPKGAFVKQWLDCEAIIRNTVALRRLAKRTQGAIFQPFETPVCQLWIQKRTEEAYDAHAGDPLARENALDRVRWMVADELAGCDPLSKSNLFAYAIKLGILVRKQARSADKGRDNLDVAVSAASSQFDQ